MDFDDNDHSDEDVELPTAGSSYESPPTNSGRGQAMETTRIGAGAEAAGVIGGRKTVTGVGVPTRYRECLKNHAVGIGGHAVDGCGEFMPAGDDGSLDALRCAACGCHRNFHRKETNGSSGAVSGGGALTAAYHHPQFSPYYRTATAGYLQHHHFSARAPPPPLALPSTSGGAHSRDEVLDDVSNPMLTVGSGLGSGSGSGRKRFRTKFTQDQKDKMLALAERVGWRIQKHDEALVQQLCNETGLRRHVLKVWMHNNKHTLGKKNN